MIIYFINGRATYFFLDRERIKRYRAATFISSIKSVLRSYTADVLLYGVLSWLAAVSRCLLFLNHDVQRGFQRYQRSAFVV